MLAGRLSLTELPAVSASVLGMAVCWPTFKLGTAWENGAFGSKSGLVMLRYRDQKLVSIVSFVRFVSRSFPVEPVAVLPGIVAKGLRSTASEPFDSRYAFKNAAWLISSSVLSWMYWGISPSRIVRAAV